jgi:protein-disulfide isomerase
MKLLRWVPAALCALTAGCATAESPTPPSFCAIPLDDSPRRGPEDAPVTLVEFADFECPFCRRVAPTLAELDAARPGTVRHVFKHLPSAAHPHALDAAIAAECAHAQGLFWEMHDALFAPGADLGDAGLQLAADAAGLDAEAFAACRTGEAPRAAIAADLAAADAAGVFATPTFFANGRGFVGAGTLDELVGLVDRAEADAAQSELPPAEYYSELETRPCR